MDENIRKDFEAQKTESQSQYDKTLIMLASGAYAVTFTFVTDVVGAKPICTGWLIVTWALWAIAIASTLTSFLASSESYQQALHLLEYDPEEYDRRVEAGESVGGRWTAATRWTNWISLIAFASGLITLAVFVNLNF